MKRVFKSRLTLTLLALVLFAVISAVPLSRVHAASSSNTFLHAGPNAIYQIDETGWTGTSQTSDTVNGWGDDQWKITLSATRSVSI